MDRTLNSSCRFSFCSDIIFKDHAFQSVKWLVRFYIIQKILSLHAGKECWLSIRKETWQDQTQFTMREHATCLPRSNYFANREMNSLTIEILHTSLNLQIQTKTWKYLFNVKEESFLVEHHNASFQYIKRVGESPRRVRLFSVKTINSVFSIWYCANSNPPTLCQIPLYSKNN